MDKTEKTLMRAVKNTYKLWTEYMKTVAAEAGIPNSYRQVLIYLRHHPGASQKDIAAFRDITMASVSSIVKDMQQMGYVRKETDPEDQRYVRLYLTDKGAACEEKLREKLRMADEKITECLTPEREQELIDRMNELSRIITEELPKCGNI